MDRTAQSQNYKIGNNKKRYYDNKNKKQTAHFKTPLPPAARLSNS